MLSIQALLAPTLPLLIALSSAQETLQPHEEDGAPRAGFPALESELEAWRQEHGTSWRMVEDEHTGYAELLFGGAVEPVLAPMAAAEWALVAEDFLQRSRELHGTQPATLRTDYVRLLPLSNAGSTDKWTVAFQQEFDGVPVEGGRVNVLLDATGRLLSIQALGVPELSNLDVVPGLAAESALLAGNQDFFRREGLAPTTWTAPELVVVRDERSGARVPRLAWRFDMFWMEPGFEPAGWSYRIDARDGTLIETTAAVHHYDVNGTVTTLATPGLAPDSSSNPETVQPLSYGRVTSSAGTVFTDVNGNFSYPGVFAAINVTVEYGGIWNQVDNTAGSEHTVTFTAQPGQANTILMNPSPTEQITAQANAYLGVNRLHDWVQSIIPGDTTVDFLAQSNVNLNDNCNAFFNGSSVNYYTAGGGCVNTAYSTVVTHEMGHWYNVLYGTGNGSDGMGEGNADVFAMYLDDDPIVGLDFCGSGCDIRTGLNTTPFCGDCCPGCHGGVHANGQVWMGAAWKIRENLNQSLGDVAGDLAADTLFLGWMNGYDQTQIRSIIELQWLALDDDDGNIDNGTPNYGDIDAGFRAQGFPGYDLDLVLISGVTALPDTESELGPYVVDATIAAPTNPPLTEATLRYRVNGGAFQDIAMSPLGGDLYRAEIPGQASPAIVEYYLTATDNNSNSNTFPEGAPADTLDFQIGVLTVFLETDFEGGSNQGWVSGAPGDDATTGEWERVDPVGTAAQPEDDTTPAPGVTCWVTGQQPQNGSLGTNDVDAGSTTLLSPVFDADGLDAARISYQRWYSNDQGASPGADVFVIDISNDGGSSWVNVETLGPTGPDTVGGWIEHEFAIADFVAPTASMRLRFVASDLGSGSIVEAAIDDIRGTSLTAVGGSDCNGNGIDDADDIASGTSLDCNSNGIPDECEPDCDSDGTPDDCETDCNQNGIPDDCETFADCNSNGIPDECEPDCDSDGTPDDCEVDCNGNGVPDDCETLADCNGNGIPDECETFADCNSNGIPDECEPDCDSDGTPDDCEVDCNQNGIPDDCEQLADCNGNGIPDECETFADCNSNGIPDECEPDCDSDGTPDDCEADCNGNGIPDDCETFADCNSNGIPDECEPDCDSDGTPDDCETDCNQNGIPDDCEQLADCNGNGIPDECETFADCNSNGIPDECEPDCDSDGTPDDCETDCNQNGIPDDCEQLADCNGNGIPDECETFADCNQNGIPDECEADCNGNGIPDDCENIADCNGNGIPDECDINSGTSSDVNLNFIPDECECTVESYCVGAPNSVGSGAVIGTSGTSSASLNALVLEATEAPAQQFGLFFYGPNQVQVAFGDGFRCVGGSLARLPIVLTDAGGQASWPLDLTMPPSAGDQITAGSSWNFQFWYRDPGAGGAGFNTSNAMKVTFCE